MNYRIIRAVKHKSHKKFATTIKKYLTNQPTIKIWSKDDSWLRKKKSVLRKTKYINNCNVLFHKFWWEILYRRRSHYTFKNCATLLFNSILSWATNTWIPKTRTTVACLPSRKCVSLGRPRYLKDLPKYGIELKKLDKVSRFQGNRKRKERKEKDNKKNYTNSMGWVERCLGVMYL